MSIPYEQFGRTAQKSRTRDALIAATRALIAEGLMPERGGCRGEGRDLANDRLSILPQPARPSPRRAPRDPQKIAVRERIHPRDAAARLDAVLEEFHRLMLETEPELRMALRLSLDRGRDQRDTSLRRAEERLAGSRRRSHPWPASLIEAAGAQRWRSQSEPQQASKRSSGLLTWRGSRGQMPRRS